MTKLELTDLIGVLKQECRFIVDKCQKETRDLTEDEEKLICEKKELIKDYRNQIEELEKKLEKMNKDLNTELEENRNNNNNINIINSMENKENKFSLLKTIRSIANNQSLDEVTENTIKMGNECARRSGLSTQGQIVLPMSETRAAITATNNGSDLIATDIFTLLPSLKADSVLVKAGAKVFSGLQGNVCVPYIGSGNVTWENENAEAKDANIVISEEGLSPNRLTAYVDLSKQLLLQDSADVENVVRQELISAVLNKLEETFLSANNGTTGPQGILDLYKPVQKTTAEDIFAMEAEVGENPSGECVYIMSPKARAKFRSMTIGKSTAVRPLYEGGEVDGTKAFCTSNLKDTNFVYGDFSNVYIGIWDALDITVDPYTQAAKGAIRIVVNSFVDVKIIRRQYYKLFECGKFSA